MSLAAAWPPAQVADAPKVPFAVGAPFRVAPDLVRLGAPDADDPHDGLLVSDRDHRVFVQQKLAQLDDPRWPLVHVDSRADPQRLLAAFADALATLARAHPDRVLAGADAIPSRFALPEAGLAIDLRDGEVDAPQAIAEPLAARLRGLPAVARVLAAIALAVQEDLVLMGWPGAGPRGDPSSAEAAAGLRMLAASVVFPSGWDPGERIGQPLRSLHAPVADGERLRLASLALSHAMTGKGPFVRHVWTLAPDGALARRPGAVAPAGGATPAGPADLADLWYRCERQVTVPLPAAGASLFLIRVFVAPLLAVAADARRRARLVESLASMSEAVIAYKQLGGARERVLRAWGRAS
jgi:hypothetical protein